MLTSTQIEQFNSQGYLVVENVVDAATLTAIKTEYAARMDKLYAGWQAQGLVGPAGKDASFFDKLSNCYQAGFEWYQSFDISLPHEDITKETPMHVGPAVFDLLTHKNLLDIAESLLGPELTSNPIQHTRIKPPARKMPNGEIRAHVTQTDWHQDRGVGLEEADNSDILTVWIAITDATVENGCLQILPNAADEMLPHCPKGQMAIADGYLNPDQAVPAPVKAGGVVLIHPLTPHASLPNSTDGFRWSFDLRYNITGQPTGRDQFPDFIARSRANPASELRDWKKWEQSWIGARDHLATSTHIPQHRWRADAPYCA